MRARPELRIEPVQNRVRSVGGVASPRPRASRRTYYHPPPLRTCAGEAARPSLEQFLASLRSASPGSPSSYTEVAASWGSLPCECPAPPNARAAPAPPSQSKTPRAQRARGHRRHGPVLALPQLRLRALLRLQFNKRGQRTSTVSTEYRGHRGQLRAPRAGRGARRRHHALLGIR